VACDEEERQKEMDIGEFYVSRKNKLLFQTQQRAKNEGYRVDRLG
jgi:hypothetical protein